MNSYSLMNSKPRPKTAHEFRHYFVFDPSGVSLSCLFQLVALSISFSTHLESPQLDFCSTSYNKFTETERSKV